MATLAKSVIQQAGKLVQDANLERWDSSDLLDWLNEGVVMVASAKRKVNTTQISVGLESGARQTLPDNVLRVVSFVRTIMPLAAGASGITYRRFLVFDAMGVALWASIYVGVGWLAGEYGSSANGILGIVGIVVFAFAVRYVLHKSRLDPVTTPRSVALTGNVGAGKSTVATSSKPSWPRSGRRKVCLS